MDENPPAEGTRPRRFTTTRWSVVLAAGADSENGARSALAQLCQLYWRPIFAFISRRGFSAMDAQDLTQDFFLTVLEGDFLQRADPERGRFRSLLLKTLQNFLNDAHDKRRALKRGGGREIVSWDDWMAEAPSHLSLSKQALDSATPERLFDIRWAATVVERAMARLREECEARGRRRVFDALSGCLVKDRGEISYTELATNLGVAEADVKRLLHQMRVRYRALLRGEVMRTVESDADVEDEIRHLCAVLAAGAR
ncbi:MAG: sigma-70 family RNA polymerase sigma factor [Chthoniobacterales bacterium]